MIKSQAELAEMLSSVYPTREYKWQGADNVADMPYIVYQLSGTENFAADNIAYVRGERFEISLYFPVTDFSPEQALEAAFDENEIFWNKTRAKASDFDLSEFADAEVYDVSGGDFYITTYEIFI